ncbi:MAG TPA: carboxylating nicotinate-nucleotide diphosphorylase [Terriglobales bacterium]|nr:carboxylating nicotinate-nucleotide diphosphorylase [Terriglobales bacterium]
MDWNSPRISSLIERALNEDHALADATTLLTVGVEQLAQAEILAKQDCVLSGLGLVPRVFELYASMSLKAGHRERLPAVVVTSHPEVFDGVRLRAGQTIAVLRGPARPLLSCERVTLNLLQRLSGIATLTRQYVDQVKGLAVRILDTRKTAPGMRALDKYAVTCGGGFNHRSDLSDAILIKNNHIRLAGGITPALARARARRNPNQLIEIEVRSQEEIEPALAGGADRLLLDNMTPDQVRAAIAVITGMVKDGQPPVPIELSGGVRLPTIRAYAETGAQFISVGALTHSAPAVDLSMRIVPVGGVSSL